MNTGSGVKPLKAYKPGYSNAAIKLQPGYAAGINSELYVKFSVLPYFSSFPFLLF